MKLTVIAPTTDAVSASEATEVDLSRYSAVYVCADNLATTEEVDITIDVGVDTFKALRAQLGDGSFVVVTLTATDYMKQIPACGRIRLAKDATAGACGVILHLSQEKN